MSGTRKVAVIVLAAGKSRRFGVRDKLLSNYRGKPLSAHVAASLLGLPYSFGVVVTSNPLVAGLFKQARFRPLFLKNSTGQSDSLKAGLRYVRKHGASHALVLLGDMPNVPRQHLKKMVATAGIHPLISKSGNTVLPPALIPLHLLPKLLHLRGDVGAGRILKCHPSTRFLPLDMNGALDIDENNDRARA